MDADAAAVVALALLWAVTGGFHDTANLTAGAIASRALTPGTATALVAAAGFAGPLVAGTAVAGAVADVVALEPLGEARAMVALGGALVAATAWNVATWRAGIPASSTHALVGGLVGAAWVAGGADGVHWGFGALADGDPAGVALVLLALVASPAVGLAAGALVQRAAARALRAAAVGWNRRLRRWQAVTVGGLAFAHGANEAQKSMGVAALALAGGGAGAGIDVPAWLVLACAATIPAAALAGGWPVVRTLGFGIFRLRPLHALDAQLTAAAVVGATSALGGPVSTSQVASSAILGVGLGDRPRSVRWDTGKEMLLAWLLTIPCTAALGAGACALGLLASGA